MNNKVKVLLYSSNLWYLGEGMLGPLFAIFTERVGGDVLDIAWAWGLYLFVTGALTIIFGKISDERIGLKKKMMIAGYALNAVFTFAYLLVNSPLTLLLVQLGLAIASALAGPTWNALYAHYENDKKAGLTWGLADGESQMITAVAMILGGFIVTYWSFAALFVIMGSIQVISTLYQSQILFNKTKTI